jgi:beta-phosphoglucomutase
MIEAIIFDFNGVIADDEPLHVQCFVQALDEFGLSLTPEEYYHTYSGMDERTCTALLLTARYGCCDDVLLRQLMERKADLFRQRTLHHRPPLFAGVVEFVKAAKSEFRLAVASGGRREQILAALEGTPIEQDFELIVSADDGPIGKPDPAIYLLALQRLNVHHPPRALLAPTNCLVVEDSKAGIQAALAAGMSVLGLATTYSHKELCEAALVLPNLEHVSAQQVLAKLRGTKQLR